MTGTSPVGRVSGERESSDTGAYAECRNAVNSIVRSSTFNAFGNDGPRSLVDMHRLYAIIMEGYN